MTLSNVAKLFLERFNVEIFNILNLWPMFLGRGSGTSVPERIKMCRDGMKLGHVYKLKRSSVLNLGKCKARSNAYRRTLSDG